MQFLVLIRGNEASVLPPAQEIALVRETYEQLAAGKDKRIKTVYPFAGERACALLCDVSTHDELQECLLQLPFFRLVRTECHPIGTPRSMVDALGRAEQQMAGLTAAAGRN
jgi:muconolactone delta-isomerase